MPILVPPTPNAPLEQGDVLADIRVFATDSDQSPLEDVQGLVLVISRPCNSLRDGRVVVAPIRKRPIPDLRAAETPDELIAFFTRVRDGDGAPDSFYIGELESSTDRFFAKFDALYTVHVPTEGVARAAFLTKHRRYRLHDDFVRDLHARLFRAFASLGFDDDRWWSDGDLALVVNKGKALEAELNASVQKLESDLDILRTSGGAKKEDRKLVEEIETAKNRRDEAGGMLAPLIAEQKRRAEIG